MWSHASGTAFDARRGKGETKMSPAENQKQGMQEVVVITGASAGVGRATVREFARQGVRLGLIARGREGLEGARRDAEQLGSSAITIECDVADPNAVEQAADRVERELGPIDIWVNNAMASVYGPFHEMSLDDFKRITEVTYLGQVYGTKAALKRMLPRDRGTIVQVSSALGFRSIPLQSAYCGAKHGVDGFTESLRTELLHMKSNVHLSVVALPGVNTPQFEWTKNLMPTEGQPVGKIYQPEVAARAIVFAAHNRRKQILVGYPTVESFIGERVDSQLLDHYLADKAWNGSLSDLPHDPHRPDNLYEPVDRDRDMGAHGRFDNQATEHSVQLWMNLHRRWFAMAGAGFALAVGAALAGRAHRSKQRPASRLWPAMLRS
jgi:short-subunit dehydrogenase